MAGIFKKPQVDTDNRIEKVLFSYLGKNKESQAKAIEIEKKHNIPASRIMDFVSKRTEIAEASPLELYSLFEAFDPDELKNYFTDDFISTSKGYKVEKKPIIEFPIRLKMLKVAEDQYIGVSDANFLMKLKDAQMVNYNPFAQRPRLLVEKDGQKYWKLQLNMAAVKSIVKSMQSKVYISNTITLDIPLNDTNQFYYDEDSDELVIESLNHFDISDGYHRYIAMSICKGEDSNFNYPMELRIVNFPDSKVRNFIYQEDQKTKLRKVDSDSMNMTSDANLVVERLNSDPMFNLNGSIVRGGDGLIDYGTLGSVIHFYHFKKKNIKNAVAERVKVEQKYRDTINAITEDDIDRLDKGFSYKDIPVLGYGIANGKSVKEIEKALTRSKEIEGSTNHVMYNSVNNQCKSLYE